MDKIKNGKEPCAKALRIRQAREALNMSQGKLGETLGLSRHAITNIENGRAEPTDFFCRFLCMLHSVNPIWLETGEGDMLNEESQNLREAVRLFEGLNPTLQAFAIEQIEALLKLQEKQGTPD